MSFMFGIPGILIQCFGLYLVEGTGNSRGWLIVAIGVVTFIIGLAFYAKAKTRSPWWCLLGLFSLLGMIILALIPDESYEDQAC